ncbi:MAG: hypothetical protein AAGD35_18015 [Actinomycetota bacterium]
MGVTLDNRRTGALPPKLFGQDDVGAVAAVLGVFTVYLVFDRLSLALVAVGADDLESLSLLLASLGNRWWLYAAVGVGMAAATVLRPERFWAGWEALDHGRTLRLLMLPGIVLMAWKGGFYEYNFYAGEAHLLDRVLAVGLAVGAAYRPALLLAFATHIRIINAQTLIPFGTPSVETIDDYLLIPLIACAAGHAVFTATGRRSTSPILLVICTSAAAHFFLPGRGKLAIDWFGNSELANLPLASYTAGWGRSGDGGVARFLADAYATFQWPVMIGTMVLELGALVAVFHPKWFRWWLPGFIVFHIVTFATTGFFFFSWVALEIGLLVILFRRELADWVAENATPARGAIAVLAVIGSPVLYQAPGLAWIDAPVSYGYEVTAVGESGRSYSVPLSAFAPLEHEMTFGRPQLTERVHLSGGYGSLVEAWELEQFEGIDDFEALEALEATQPETTLTEVSTTFLLRFFDATTGDGPGHWLLAAGPPVYFWAGGPDPTYDFQEPLAEMEVVQITAIHGDDRRPIERRVPVLRIERAADGTGVATPVDAG